MHEPVYCDGTDGTVGVKGTEVGGEGFVDRSGGFGGVWVNIEIVVGHFDEFVCVEEAEPTVLVAMPLVAVAVHGVLHGAIPLRSVEVVKSDGGVRDTPAVGPFGCGERRFGSIIHDVEAADANVVVMVNEELREVFYLIFDGVAESDSLLVVCGR